VGKAGVGVRVCRKGRVTGYDWGQIVTGRWRLEGGREGEDGWEGRGEESLSGGGDWGEARKRGGERRWWAEGGCRGGGCKGRIVGEGAAEGGEGGARWKWCRKGRRTEGEVGGGKGRGGGAGGAEMGGVGRGGW